MFDFTDEKSGLNATAIQRRYIQQEAAWGLPHFSKRLLQTSLTSLRNTDLKPETKQFKNQMSPNINCCFVIIINIFMTLLIFSWDFSHYSASNSTAVNHFSQFHPNPFLQ
jgi:hypothetical protein